MAKQNIDRSRCESYNTAQLRVLQGGDISEVLEEEGVEGFASRPRAASLNPDGEPATSLAALHLDTNSASSRLSVPISTGTGDDRRFVSYNMTHGRAISPVVSNYFGLPTERESEKPSSLPFFGSVSRSEGETDYGALNFLSKKLRDRYGFLAGDTATANAEAASTFDEDDEDAWDDITATTPLSLEKEIAVEVIGDLVTHTRSSFLPYFEKTIETVMPLAEHPYEGVRKSTISTLHRSYAMLFAIAEESGQMPKWQPGLPLQIQPAKEVKKFGEILMTATIKMWAEEDDRYVVNDCFVLLAFNLLFYMMIFPLNPAHFDTPKSVIDANGDSISDTFF